jgi:hypothetical protein
MTFNGGTMGGIEGGSGFSGKFDNPILLPSADYYPTTAASAFEYCLYFYHNIPNFRQVQKRVVRYFITDYEFIGDGDEKEREDERRYLRDVLDLEAKMLEMGDDWGCYGNSFMRLHYPFTRYLKDTRFGKLKLYSIEQFPASKIKFNFNKLTYSVPDPKTKGETMVELPFVDFEDRNKEHIKLIRIDPRDIRIVYNELSDTARYIYKFQSRVREQIKQGVLTVVNSTPRYMLEAMQKNCDLEFHDGEVFHFKAPSVSGVSHSCWGLPELIANFRQIYQIFIYMKADEAIARDMITPFRIFSMAPGQGDNDILGNMDGLFFQQQAAEVIANRRKDPTAIHAMACPVNYQEFGATGKQYAPKELIEFQNNQLLNGSGFPEELYKGTMQPQGIPSALRMFENNFWFIYNNFNKFVKWVVKKTQAFVKEPPMEVKWAEPQMIDNMENTNLISQMVMSGVLPYDVLFKKFGISDPVKTMMKRKKQDKELEIGEAELTEEMERKQQAADILQASLEEGGGEGGAGGGMSGGMPITDLYQQASQLAQQWLSMPVGQRRQNMMQTQASDNQLYLQAKQIMEQQRSQLQSQGAQMMKEQNGYF